MNQILKEIKQIENWKNLYDSFASKNNLNSISSKLINQQNFQNFQNFIETIVEKGPRKSKKRWISNQRRILYVVLNCISVISRITIQQFKKQEIQRLSRVFLYKDKHSIQYELIKLSSNSGQNRRRWQKKEQNLLENVVTQVLNKLRKSTNKNKWNEIARQLFIASKGEYFRQGKHCRERFYKLKTCKGSKQNSEEIQSSPQISAEISLKFHSHNSFHQSSKIQIQDNGIMNIKLVNFNSQNDKKQPVYNENQKSSNSKSQLTKNYPQIRNQDEKIQDMNIKTSECIEKLQQKQQQQIISFSQNAQQKTDGPQNLQVLFLNNEVQKTQLNYFNTLAFQNFYQKDQINIISKEQINPSTIQMVYMNNILNGNTLFQNLFPITFPIWPVLTYPFTFPKNFQQ